MYSKHYQSKDFNKLHALSNSPTYRHKEPGILGVRGLAWKVVMSSPGGVPQGESSGSRSVQILSKFSTLWEFWTEGRKGEGISRFSSLDHLRGLKKGWRMTSSEPVGPYPSRLGGSRCSSPRSRLCASQLMYAVITAVSIMSALHDITRGRSSS